MMRFISAVFILTVARNSAFKNTVNKLRFSTRYFTGSQLKSTPKPDEPSSTGHQSSVAAPVLSEEEQRILDSFRTHQQQAAKLSVAEEMRTLVDQSIGYGVLSTNSVQYPGFPTGSVVGFAVDEEGKPFFVFSSMSAHTQDVKKDGRVSLTVTAKDFKGAADGRVVLIGSVSELAAEKKSTYRDIYMVKHKDAFWIDFGDFSYYTMSAVETARYVGGFARAGGATGEDYLSAIPDPISAFAEPVMKHMNEDHSDSTAAMVKHYVGLPVSEAEIVSLDRLGMTVKAKVELSTGGYTKIRLPFPKPVTERKAVKEVLVEMTRASST